MSPITSPAHARELTCHARTHTHDACRISNQISATIYNQTPVSQEQKELWSPFLYWLVALVKYWSHTNFKIFVIIYVWARDKNVHPSDLSNYQTFVPYFRQLVPSPLKWCVKCQIWNLWSPTLAVTGYQILAHSITWVIYDKAWSRYSSCHQYSDTFYGNQVQDLAKKFKIG